jgi:precorrin-2/cobalt-factor-2 C20-methyltransferase
VIYKGGRHLPAVAERLAAAGRLEGAVLGELLGMPGQRVVPVASVADLPASYLATVVVPPKRVARAAGSGEATHG